jgi:hypothetical protein
VESTGLGEVLAEDVWVGEQVDGLFVGKQVGGLEDGCPVVGVGLPRVVAGSV